MLSSIYFNIPFKWHGKSFDGADCIGIVLLFYKHELNIELPHPVYSEDRDDPIDYFDAYYKELGFYQVDAPQYGDVISFRTGRYAPRHAAVVLSETQALHSDKDVGSGVINYSTDPKWVRRTVACYRYRKPE